MIPAEVILPPRPARKARRPQPSPASPASPAVQCPTRGTRPAIAPPPVLDALAQDAEYLALCDERRDDAVERQDSDLDAEWADLAPWMHRTVDADGNFRAEGLGVGEGAGGRLVWSRGPRGDA